MIRLGIICMACILVSSCSRKSIHALGRKGVFVHQEALGISAGNRGKKLAIQYLGCGGLFIRHEGLAIMIDPFFSHQRFFRIGKAILAGGKIRSKPKRIQRGRQRIIDSLKLAPGVLEAETKAIFAAHGHYDHLMDVPFIYQQWLQQQPDVYLNNSAFNTCANVIAASKLHDLEPIVSVRDQRGSSIDFSAADGTVLKVYPLLAAHNPHSNKVKLFSGSVMHPLAHFTSPRDRTRITDWLEGRTLSFLIDITDGNTILFRMFVQSSSASYPDGIPPADLLAEKSVDLAVLGVASYRFSESTYPCEYLKRLQPRHAMYIHWEDFFRPYGRKPKTVMKSNIPRFFRTILPVCKEEYILPAPGVVVTVSY